MIKAVHGGGGRGIRRVDENDSDFEETSSCAWGPRRRTAFGSRDLYLERCVERFRHVEVQVLRDSHGNVLVPGYRDCSVQRNHQKVVEESASTHAPRGAARRQLL